MKSIYTRIGVGTVLVTGIFLILRPNSNNRSSPQRFPKVSTDHPSEPKAVKTKYSVGLKSKFSSKEAVRNAMYQFVDDLAPPLSSEEENKVLQLSNRSVSSLMGLALSRCRNKNSKECDEQARNWLLEAASTEPDNPLPLMALCQADPSLLRDRALIEKLARMAPNAPLLSRFSYQSALKAGNKSEALQALQSASASSQFELETPKLAKAIADVYEIAGRSPESAKIRGFYKVASISPQLVGPFLSEIKGSKDIESKDVGELIAFASIASDYGSVPGMKFDNYFFAIGAEKRAIRELGRRDPKIVEDLFGQPFESVQRGVDAESEVLQSFCAYQEQRETILSYLDSAERNQFLDICLSSGEVAAFKWVKATRPQLDDALNNRFLTFMTAK